MKLTAREALILLLVAVAGLWAYTSHERSVGARDEKLAQSAKHIATLDSSLKIARTSFRTDTVTLFRNITHTETRIDSVLHTDTVQLSRTDTVKVTVGLLQDADSTIKACRMTIRDCGQLRALEQSRGDSLEARVRLLQAARPSIFSRCGVSVGYGATDKGFGPAVLVGCRIAP